VRAAQELMTYELNYDRWRALHLPDLGIETGSDGEVYEGVKEFYPSEVDDFLARFGDTVDEPREMFGDELFGMEV